MRRPGAGATADDEPDTPVPGSVRALADELVERWGADVVSTHRSARRAASTDFAHLSPVLVRRLPTRIADLVARPRTVAELADTVRLAYRHGVPLTPRGRGTGNYGQAVPMAGGLVLDAGRCDRVLDIGAGFARVQAGATFVAVEAAARRTGQELALLPTTTGSTVGGFLAGGAGGLGSIGHGWIWDDFVPALRVVTGTSDGQPVDVSGDDCRPYLHAYGVTGIIATATVRLVPARSWVALLASFDTEVAATRAGHALLRTDPAPRLVSLDEPGIVATYPADPALPTGRYSLRALVDPDTLAGARGQVRDHGGTVEAVRPDGAGHLSTLAFNHVTLRARRARPELCHLQVAGTPLVATPDEVRAALPGAMLHLDGLRTGPPELGPERSRGFGGLLLSVFSDAERLYAGVDRLRALGVEVVDPHTWLLGGPQLDRIRATAARNDPAGLLNPGKLP